MFVTYSLEDILFNLRAKKAEEFFEKKNYSKAIIYDNVKEKYIYYYLKNALINDKKSIDINKLEIKTMILGLNKEHLADISQYIKVNIVDSFEIFKNNIFNIHHIYSQNNKITDNLIQYCKIISDEISTYMYKDQNEFLLNQPITFENNDNYIYVVILYLLTMEIINIYNNINNKKNDKYKPAFLMSAIEELKDTINNFKNYSNNKKWNILFYLISAYKSFVVDRRKILISLNEDNKNLNLNFDNIKDENILKILNNIFIPDLLKDIDLNNIVIDSVYNIYDSEALLSSVKIDCLNENNFYTPDFNILKSIIYDILNSNSINKYIEDYLYIKLNPFKDKEFYELIWKKYVTFVKFHSYNELNDLNAETFRQFSIIFFSVYPLIDMKIDNKYLRLFNYGFFIILCIHEFVGHLEKIFFFYINKEYKVKTPKNLNADFYVDNADDFEEEKKFLEEHYKDLINDLSKKRESNLINQSSKNDSKENKNVDKILNLEEDKSITINEIEGGYNAEKMIFGLIINNEKITINQVLFVLNKNNYTSIDNTRRLSTLNFSYQKSYEDKKDYVNVQNFSLELKNILNNLQITENELLILDKHLLEEYFIKDLINENMLFETDRKTIRLQYRNLFSKYQKRRKYGSCIKRFISFDN